MEKAKKNELVLFITLIGVEVYIFIEGIILSENYAIWFSLIVIILWLIPILLITKTKYLQKPFNVDRSRYQAGIIGIITVTIYFPFIDTDMSYFLLIIALYLSSYAFFLFLIINYHNNQKILKNQNKQ